MMSWRTPIVFSLVGCGLLAASSHCLAADKSGPPPTTLESQTAPAAEKTSPPQPQKASPMDRALGIRVVQQGRRVLLMLKRPAAVDVYGNGKRVQSCPKALQCDITTAVQTAGNGSLTFVGRDGDARLGEKTLSMGRFAHLFTPAAGQAGDDLDKRAPSFGRPKQRTSFAELVVPHGGEEWEHGTTQTVVWRVHLNEEGRRLGNWRFAIHREGEPHGTAMMARGYSTRPIRPGVFEYAWHWPIPRETPLADTYMARIEELPPAGSADAPLVAESGRPFRIAARYAHDLEITDIALDGRDHIMADIREHAGPLAANVQILIEKGYRRQDAAGLTVWETTAARTRTVPLDLRPGGSARVDLGPADIPRVDLGQSCGLSYRLRVDAADWVGETNEANNERIATLYYRSDAGRLDIVMALNGSWSVLSPASRSIAFRYFDVSPRRATHDGLQQIPELLLVDVQNCSRHPVSGTVIIVQTLNPGSTLGPHGVTIVDEHHTLAAGQRHTFGVGQWYMARDSEITIRFAGDIATWAPTNPYTVSVDRRD